MLLLHWISPVDEVSIISNRSFRCALRPSYNANEYSGVFFGGKREYRVQYTKKVNPRKDQGRKLVIIKEHISKKPSSSLLYGNFSCHLCKKA